VAGGQRQDDAMSDPDQEAIQVWTDPVWLVRVQESEAIVGPVSLDQIKRGIDKNKLAKDAEIALDGSDSWVAAVGHLKRVIRDFGGLTGARRRLGKYREPPPSVDMRGAPMADAPELEARPIAPRGARAGKCGRCGSSRVVRDAQLAVMGGASIVLQLAGGQRSVLAADVCGKCGNVDLVADSLDVVREAYRAQN
jgi:hypothetical protein